MASLWRVQIRAGKESIPGCRLSADRGRPYSPYSDMPHDAGQPPPAHRQPAALSRTKWTRRIAGDPIWRVFLGCNQIGPGYDAFSWRAMTLANSARERRLGTLIAEARGPNLRQCLRSVSEPLTVIFNLRQFGDAAAFSKNLPRVVLIRSFAISGPRSLIQVCWNGVWMMLRASRLAC